MGAKIGAAGASGGGGLPVPADAFVREDGVITAPPGGGGAVTSVNGQAGVVVLTGADLAAVVTLTDAATIAVDASAGSFFRVTLGGDRTLGTPSDPADGQQIVFEVVQGGGGNFTLGFSAAYSFPASIPQPSLSTTAGQRDFLQFAYDAGDSLWWCTGFVPGQNAGIVAIAQGGTGQGTQQGALNALAGAQTAGQFLRGNGTNVAMSAIQAGDLPAGWSLLAGTGLSGYTLVNATGNVLTWTVPDDGQLHWFQVVGELVVSSVATGGALALAFTDPGGTGRTPSVLAASQASGFHSVPALLLTCAPNTTVSITQTALTGGAAIFYGGLWGM